MGLRLEKVPSSLLVSCSVHRLSSSAWSPLPEAPTFPAFFLGALSVDFSPLDTFMKLEVCSPSLPRLSWVLGVL